MRLRPHLLGFPPTRFVAVPRGRDLTLSIPKLRAGTPSRPEAAPTANKRSGLESSLNCVTFSSSSAGRQMVAAQLSSKSRGANAKSVAGACHGFRRKESPIHRSHVDIPALAFRRVRTGQIARSHVARLNIDTRRSDVELPLVRIDCDFCVGHRTIAVSEQIDLSLPELTSAVVAVNIRIEPSFTIDINNGPGLQDTGDALGPRRYFDDVKMPQLPMVGTRGRPAVGRARMGRRVCRIHASEHLAFADEFEVVLLELGGKTTGMIGVPGGETRR